MESELVSLTESEVFSEVESESVLLVESMLFSEVDAARGPPQAVNMVMQHTVNMESRTHLIFFITFSLETVTKFLKALL